MGDRGGVRVEKAKWKLVKTKDVKLEEGDG